MSSRYFARLAAAFAAVATLTLNGLPAKAGGCGCEAPSQTVYHVHQRCHHHCCRNYPPVGMVVQSAPIMAAPMMAAPFTAAPMMAAPASFAAPVVALAPAPSFTLTQQPTLQLSLPQQSTCASSGLTQEQVLKALSILANDSQSANSGLRSAGRSADDRLADLERRLSRLEKNTEDIVEVMKGMQNK